MSKLDCPSEYDHLRMQVTPPSGMMPHRKFRWVARLFKDREEIGKAQFVKIHGRPCFQPSHDPPHLPDLDYFFEGGFDYCDDKAGDGWKYEDLKDFDEVVLALFDGCGYMMERWTLGDITRKPWPLQGIQKNEAMSEDDYDVFEVTFNYCLHNYENFLPD